MVPISLLDLSPIVAGGSAALALRNTLDLARHSEEWGYKRFWLAEHHNMPGNASSATAVLIGFVAGGTSRIRVGAGGILLNNHAPLVVAEQFGTLEALYPGRIDLGVGRATSTNPDESRALRRDPERTREETFRHEVKELQDYLSGSRSGSPVRAIPGEGLQVPIWLLSSNSASAQRAAEFGLPLAFASHFAPGEMMQAVEVYRQCFQPSEALNRPYVMLAVNVFAADTDAHAQQLFTSLQQRFVELERRQPGPLKPPVEDMDVIWSPEEKHSIEQKLMCSVVGGRSRVEAGLKELILRTSADELLITAQIFDHAARLRSFQVAAEIRDALSS